LSLRTSREVSDWPPLARLKHKKQSAEGVTVAEAAGSERGHRIMVVTATSVELSERELRDLLHREAQARLGITGDELVRRAAEGTLEDAGDVADLLILADLLEDSRQPIPA